MTFEEHKIIVRDARSEDAPQIIVLLEQLGYPNTSQFVANKIHHLSGRKRDRILVAIKDERVVGLLSLHLMPLVHREGDLCRISAIVVAKEYRGQYIGQRLMEMAEAYAQAHKCCRIEITSGDQRTEAHDFYRNLGYQEVSKRFIKDI